jgi:nucleoside-diphosphate-sugar epimerase
VLRTARFFPEDDDNRNARDAFDNDNLKVNELLYRRADIEDVVSAHLLAVSKAPALGFDRFVISANTPFTRDDLPELHTHAERVVQRLFPAQEAVYRQRGWALPGVIDRVYVNERARTGLGWQPRYDFDYAIQQLRANQDYRSPLALAVGAKGYHERKFLDQPYPVS